MPSKTVPAGLVGGVPKTGDVQVVVVVVVCVVFVVDDGDRFELDSEFSKGEERGESKPRLTVRSHLRLTGPKLNKKNEVRKSVNGRIKVEGTYVVIAPFRA